MCVVRNIFLSRIRPVLCVALGRGLYIFCFGIIQLMTAGDGQQCDPSPMFAQAYVSFLWQFNDKADFPVDGYFFFF